MLLTIVLIVTTGFQTMLGMTRLVITLSAAEMGATALEIGALTAVYSLVPLFLAVHAGKIADHAGDRLPSIWGLVGMTAGLAVPFWFSTLGALFVSQIVVGLSQLFLAVSMQNVLGNAAPDARRDHYFGMFTTAVALAGGIGPVFGGYLAEHVSYSFVFLVSVWIGCVSLVFACFIPVIVRDKNKVPPEDGSAARSLDLLKIPALRKAMLSSSLVAYSRDIFVVYFPLFAAAHGMADSAIGWIIGIQSLTMVVVRLFLTKLTGLFRRSRILLCSIALTGLSYLFFPVTDRFLVFACLSALMGAGLGIGNPLTMIAAYNASPSNRTGEVLGIRLATNRLSQIIAPLLFGAIASWGGLAWVFYASATVLLGGSVFLKARFDRKLSDDTS